MNVRLCSHCKKKPLRSRHFNTKYCNACRKYFLKKPKTSMTKDQIRKAKSMIGKMPREEIAKRLAVSLPSLKRAFRGTRLAYYNYCVVNPGLVREVNKYYETHDQPATAKHFGLSRKQIDHIVYRYKSHKPKTIPWTNEQFIQLARFGGLVSFTTQAKYFKRPNAFEGSIKSAWMKKFGVGGGCINGMSDSRARYIVTKACPRIKTRFWETKDKKRGSFSRKSCLWIDMEKHLLPDTPEFIREAIVALADFQRWLFESQNPKRKILQTIGMDA